MQKISLKILIGIAIFVSLINIYVLLINENRLQIFKEKIFLTEKNQESILDLQNQVASLNKKILSLTNDSLIKNSEIEALKNRPIVKEKTQDQIITEAVAKTAPAVVSIVATKDIPKVEIVYENPFGNDPNFRDFGIRVPVIKQRGTEKVEIGAGTGFIITSDGFVLTNKHVVADKDAEYTAILSDNQTEKAYVIYRDLNYDIAILKISGTKRPTVELGSSNTAKLGQSVIAIGNALGEYSNSVSIGIISGLNRDISAKDQNGASVILNGVIQTDAAINPGNSGGPLIDLNGQAIGINVATVIGSNDISFAIPIDIVKSIITKILNRQI